MKLKKRVAVTVAVMLSLACPHMAFAGDDFTSKEFLKWKVDSQVFYLETSVGMAGVIATQVNPTKAKCIDAWYYGDEKEGNTYILETMTRFPDYHPRAVILAAIEKKCGQF